MSKIKITDPSTWYVNYNTGAIRTAPVCNSEIILILPNDGSINDVKEAVKEYLRK